jgi:hypothetical protein
MTFTMHHGVSLHAGTAVQEVSVRYKKALNKVLGMVSGLTQTVAAYSHTAENSGTVRGKGDLTLSPGLGSASVTGISGGLTHIDEVGTKETLGTEAEWDFMFTHMPHAA